MYHHNSIARHTLTEPYNAFVLNALKTVMQSNLTEMII